MTVEKLVRMANEIAAFFRPYSAEEGQAGVWDHIAAFWTPGMRTALMAHAQAGGAGMDPIAVAAMCRTARAESPIVKETEGPGALGQLASDAG